MEEFKLKPCPFCGAEAVIDYGMRNEKYWACCINPNCKIQAMTAPHKNKSVVVRYWNRRATDGKAD